MAMLLLFGVSWPFSIYKSWKTRVVGSKSLIFLICVFVGYLAGITHKLLYSKDVVIVFYCINAAMVALDIVLYLRNRRLARMEEVKP